MRAIAQTSSGRFPALIALIVAFALAVSACSDRQGVDATEAVDATSSDLAAMNIALDERVAEFGAVLSSGDISGLIDFMPPVVVEELLREYNVTRDFLGQEMDRVWAETMALVEITDYGFDTQANPITKAPGGRSYKLIPTQIEMVVKESGAIVTAESETLAIRGSSDWYLIRLDEPEQIALFRKTYPDMASIEIAAPAMRMNGEIVQP